MAKKIRKQHGKKASGKKTKSAAQPKTKKATPTRRSEPAWIRDLRSRKEPLSLAIDEDGQIEFWKYSFNGPHDYNLMVWHPEGDLDFGFEEPSRRERYGLDYPSFRHLSYQAKRSRVLACLEEHELFHLYEDGIPWPETETDLDEWLDAIPGETEFSDPPVSAWDSQYLPGHVIFDELTPKEQRLWQIDQGDVGGPASGGLMVTGVECTMDDLNEIIRRKNLPFVVVEDKRRPQPTTSVFGTK